MTFSPIVCRILLCSVSGVILHRYFAHCQIFVFFPFLPLWRLRLDISSLWSYFCRPVAKVLEWIGRHIFCCPSFCYFISAFRFGLFRDGYKRFFSSSGKAYSLYPFLCLNAQYRAITSMQVS